MDAAKTGKLIKELRTEKSLTQQELASLLNVSPTAVSKWENGRALPDISMLEPLSNVFNISFAEIILGERAAEKAERTEVTMETPLNTDNKAEAAIKAVIDESISQKQKNVRKTITMIAAGMTILALLLFVIGIVRKKQNAPTLDISGLTQVSRTSPKEDEEPITIGNRVYVPYTDIKPDEFGNMLKGLGISDPAKLGKVIAYEPQSPQGWWYYCTLEGADGWLLLFEDDKRDGIPSEKNCFHLYCTRESLENIPDWVKELHISTDNQMPQ